MDQAGGETELEVHKFGKNREKENLAPLPRGGTLEAHGMARRGSISNSRAAEKTVDLKLNLDIYNSSHI